MTEEELKSRLIAECEESNLTLMEVRNALDDAVMHFFLLSETVLKNAPVKNVKKERKSERLCNFALGFSIVALLIVLIVEFVMK